MNGDDRMLTLGLEEIVGNVECPDIRPNLKPQRSPLRTLAVAAGLLVAIAGVWWLLTPSARTLAIRSHVAAIEAGAPAWAEDYDRLVLLMERDPSAVPSVLDELDASLAKPITAVARARLILVPAHAPTNSTAAWLQSQLARHRDRLPPSTLITLAARNVAGAAEVLATRPLQAPEPERLHHLLWLLARGDRTRLGAIEAIVGTAFQRPEGLPGGLRAFLAAHVLRYRIRAPGAWDTAYVALADAIRKELERDVDRAYRQCLDALWFYEYLNVAEPLPLDDWPLRLLEHRRSFDRAGRTSRQVIEDLLAKMK